MPSIQVPINNTLPWTQEVATNNQAVFSTNWTADVATDVVVYARAAAADANDATQIVSSADYNVAFVGSNEYVEVTFTVGRTTGDIITIMRNTPADRLNLYINTNFTPTMLNGDFGRMVMMIQQRLLGDIQLAPKYNNSATLNPNGITDIILPVLPAGHIWQKNAGDTAIEALSVPDIIPGLAGNFTADNRLVKTTDFANNLLEQTDLEVTDANVMQPISGSWGLDSPAELNLDATTNLNLQGQRWPASIGAENQVIAVSGGILAYVDVAIAPNPTTTNVIPKFVNTTGGVGDSQFSESGTNLLLPADPTVALAAATKQYVDAGVLGTVKTVVGTATEIDVDSTDPENPIVSLAAEVTTDLALLNGLADGELIIGSTGNPAVQATLTAGSGVSILNAAGSITISATGSGGTVTSVSGTANQIDSTGGATPVLSLSSTAVAPGSLAVTALSASTAVVANASKELTSVALTDGQLLIGSTGADPVGASLTAGTGITITPGAGTLEIAATASGSASTVTIDVTQVAHGFSVGDWVYLNGATYTLAANTSAAVAEVVGVVSAVAGVDDFTLQMNGEASGLSGLTAGTVYFLGTAGALTATPPTTIGEVVKPLLVANSTTSGVMINFRGDEIGTTGGTINTGTAGQLAYYAASGEVLSGGQLDDINGTSTNDNAAAGKVGEFISSTIVSGSGVSLTDNTDTNITSISLTAGDWDVWGNVFLTNTGIGNVYYGWTSSTSATLPDVSLISGALTNPSGILVGLSVPYRRFSLSGTTTVYLSTRSSFSTGTSTACGGIYARRAR